MLAAWGTLVFVDEGGGGGLGEVLGLVENLDTRFGGFDWYMIMSFMLHRRGTNERRREGSI
jgi:hypothetical protein